MTNNPERSEGQGEDGVEPIPMATEPNSDGWAVSYGLIHNIQIAIEDQLLELPEDDYYEPPDAEQVEQVLLAIIKMGYAKQSTQSTSQPRMSAGVEEENDE